MLHPRPTRRRQRSATVAVTLLAALVLSGCSDDAAEPASSSAGDRATEAGLPEAYDLEDLDARAVIERLDAMAIAERPGGLRASVQPDALVLTDIQRGETRLPMPEDEVYLSIAPYRELTHDCHFHSLTTCIGELGNADVQVTLTDADGETVLDEARQTFDNGFVGVWVPRGLVDATLRITHQGRSGTATVSTAREDDPTCITTLRLR